MYGCVWALLAFLHTCDAGLGFASYYGDNMVLQKAPERAVLWGYGPEGAQVTLWLSGPKQQKTPPVTVTKGIWRVTLDPVEAGGPYNVTAILQSSTVNLTNVLFGDVWLCGGQSNMAFEMFKIFNASKEISNAANYTQVRIYMAAMRESETELIDLEQVEVPWSTAASKQLANFSAVCWLFGRNMYDNLKYPIGLVESCWGGTSVEAWSSSRALQHCGLQDNTDTDEDEDEDEDENENGPSANSILWNSMIHPLLNMTLKGAIWYQGEKNADYHPDKYSCSFPAMIDDWRFAFHQGSGGQTAPDFPFGFVQLCTYKKGSTDDGFPNIRWHQTADIGFVPNPRMKRTFMAVALDLPDDNSPYGTIHPRDKQDVAYRLTLGARAVAYQEKDVHFRGPFPGQILITEVSLNITYDQTVSVTSSNDIFEICCTEAQAPCGPQSPWVPAPIINGGPASVQVSTRYCQPMSKVAALRYAWKDWPCDFKSCPVYSARGDLPAPPFQLNRWPGNTP